MGRTVLHLAALWGDMVGVRAALDMGADPSILDDRGNTSADLARRGGYDEVVAALIDAEKKAEYYYEVYSLESDGNNSDVSGKGSESGSEEKKEDEKPQFIRPNEGKSFISGRDKAHSIIPDLERSSVFLSEDEDSGNGNRESTLIELQDSWPAKGFGYFNERGELILEQPAGQSPHNDKPMSTEEEEGRPFQPLYHNGNMDGDSDDDEEHDSNNEGYAGNDYPDSDYDNDDYRDADAYSDVACSDDDDGWRLDFRNRYVSKNELGNRYSFGVDGSDDGEYDGFMQG